MPELRKLFLGERRFWPGSHPVKLVVRNSGTAEHNAILRLLGMTESEYKQYWTQQVFRGEAQAEPLTVSSTAMQAAAIVGMDGAIALFEVADVKPGMKVVTVNNLSPNAKGYPLHD